MAKTRTIRVVPPKKTGKKGIGPIDEKTDDVALTVPGSPAEKGQASLPGVEDDGPGDPNLAKVENGQILMQFVRVKPVKMKDGKRFLNLEFAVGLTDESSELLGEAIEEAYGHLTNGISGLTLELDPHVLDLAMEPTAKAVIHQTVTPTRVSLANVQEKGSGEERTVIRLSFVAPVVQTDALATWACNTHGTLVWVKMGESQRKLK